MSAFDFGGLLGGGLSGATAGMSAFGPIGAVAGGLLGGLGSAFGGGGQVPTYEPTDLQKAFVTAAEKQTTAGRSTKKRIKAEANMLARSGGPGAAEAFLQSYVDRFSNPEFIEKKLTKSYKKDIDYGADSYWNIADQLYKQQGIGFTGDEYGGLVGAAKARGIRSPQAFGDMIKQQMITEGKVATPQQEMLGMMFGGIRRDPSGRVLDLYPKLNTSLTA